MAIGLGSVMAGASAGNLLGALLPPLGREWAYQTNFMWKNQRFDVGTALQLRWRGVISKQYYLNDLGALGIHDSRAEAIYELGKRLLEGFELIQLERRGKMNTAEATIEAERVGIIPETYDRLKQITEVIPAANDIITFAVREVYSPEIAEAFGQFEGIDEVVEKAADDIKAIGMTKETFGKYWAAHWMLPSVGQGFEMLHRSVIPAISTETQPMGLDRLMTALDIMPAWRDKLTAISYNPFTRVDVRRMHKLEILSDKELVRAYMDLGYDEDKANKMKEFTIAYNAEPIEDEQSEKDKDEIKERDLTKTDLLSGYRDGLLNKNEVAISLAGLGYDNNEINYYISRVEYKQDQEEIDNYLRYYSDAYIHGVMDFNETTDKLGELNLPASRVERLFQIWDLEKMARSRKPTKSELMTFLRKKVIDKPTFISEMEGLDYPQKYIDWYLATV